MKTINTIRLCIIIGAVLMSVGGFMICSGEGMKSMFCFIGLGFGFTFVIGFIGNLCIIRDFNLMKRWKELDGNQKIIFILLFLFVGIYIAPAIFFQFGFFYFFIIWVKDIVDFFFHMKKKINKFLLELSFLLVNIRKKNEKKI